MKTTNETFLTKQSLTSIQDDYLIYLFEQWDYPITDRDSATQIKIQGDATDLFSNGDVFLVPLDNFETEHTITSAPSYDSPTNKTTIICSGSSFATTVVGLDVAKKRDITSKILQNGFSEIRIGTEGETLNSSLADDLQIAVDNSDEFFYDNDGSSGIFNSGRIFWIKIIFKLKDDSTEFLYFAGTVYLPSVQPISILQNVEFMATGHLKELERYPGFRITDENGKLPMNPGIETVSVVEPSAGIIECIRDLKYKFPDGIDIKNLIINSISISTNNTPAGWHVIKFQPPDLWQYDFGDWSAETEGDTAVTLTSKKGHTINVDLPATFDIEAREDWFFLKSRLEGEAQNIGKFSLQFSNGKKINLKPTFERILFYDSSGTSYADISLYANTYDSDQKEIVGSADDEFYIMSTEPFYGIYFELDTDLDGTITWYYSTGYNTYATLTKTDGTSDFSQDGAVTWDAPEAWRNIDAIINSVLYANYYIIKIVCTAYTSGSCNLKRLFKYIRLIGDDGAELNIKCKFEHFAPESRDDKIVLREDSSAVIQAHAWKENISVYQYLKALLSEANYSTSQQSLDSMAIASSSEVISLMGRPPKHFYHKKPTAFFVDPNYPLQWGGIKIWLGIEDELWSFDFENGYQFIDKLDPYVRASDDAYFRVEIRRLQIDGNGYLQGMAWKDYLDQPTQGRDYGDYGYALRTPAIVFRSTDLATITEQNWIDVSGYSVFASQEVCFRIGQQLADYSYIGQYSSASTGVGGENLILPFAQRIWFAYPNLALQAENRNSITDDTETSTGLLYKNQELSPGHFALKASHVDEFFYIGVCFCLGQKGFVVWDEDQDSWAFVMWDGTDFYISYVNYAGTITDYFDLGSFLTQVLAGCYYNQYVYLALMDWDDSGETFPGDLSDCKLERFDSAGSSKTTLFDFSADSVEANQSLTSGDEIYCTVLDLIYNPDEDTLHGCLLNRADFEYHYFVYDITNDELYTTQTGTGFTFNKGRQIKELCYNSSDNKVYAVVVDLRNQQETAFLINATYAPPGNGADGTEITLTYETDIINNEYDVFRLKIASGIIYGLTKPNNYLFQYSTNIYPVMFLNDSGEDNFRDCLDDLAQMLNMIHSIGPERKFYLKGRESNKGSMTIYEKTHYIQDTMHPIRSWQHRYDGVEVHWENPFTGDKGVERSGVFGWQRRILKINNRFVQYPQLAKLIADVYSDFFDDYRLELQFRTCPLWQLDNRDKFQFSHSVNRFDFAATMWWIIQEIILDHWNGEMEIRSLEIKS